MLRAGFLHADRPSLPGPSEASQWQAVEFVARSSYAIVVAAEGPCLNLGSPATAGKGKSVEKYLRSESSDSQ